MGGAAWLGMILLPVAAQEQERTIVRPPTSFETRNAGETTEGGATIRVVPAEPEPRTVTYVAVTDLRTWRDVEGRSLRGRLIAFDAADESAQGRELVRKGRIRLWVDGHKRVSELELSRLSEADRTFVRSLEQAAKQMKKAPETAPEPAKK